MNILRGIFGSGNTWDDESPSEQRRAMESHPLYQMGVIPIEAEGDEILGSSGDFGTSLTNPIPVNGPLGAIVYLNRLRTQAGEIFLYHRQKTATAPNYPHPIDVYEVLSIDGGTHLHLHFACYHPRRSQILPRGLSRIPWPKDPAKQSLMRVPYCGADVTVSEFPWGLPQAIAGSPALQSISPMLPSVWAQMVQALLEKLCASGRFPPNLAPKQGWNNLGPAALGNNQFLRIHHDPGSEVG